MGSSSSLNIGVIGSGISGLGAAWLLSRNHRVTLFERNDYLGGHTHTMEVAHEGRPVAIDTGFMVFNRPNYPLLTALFDHLRLGDDPTSMSFSVSIGDGEIEYGGTSLFTLFAQPANLFRWGHWRMLRDILRFNRAALRALDEGCDESLSLGEWLWKERLGDELRDRYLLPMAAAIWSCPREQMAEFPTVSFLRFFRNHGLVQLEGRPQWRTLRGGSRSYVRAMRAQLGDRVWIDCPAYAVTRHGDGVTVTTADGESHVFDAVVLACHADEALALLTDASAEEHAILGAFRFQPNQVYLHRDSSLMPRRRAVWSSWNYLAPRGVAASRPVSVTYWMNSLQRLDTDTSFFVTLNPHRPPRDELVEAEMVYDHPVFDLPALRAQRRLDEIQGRRRTWFAGAWMGYGFHEDGFRAAVEVAQALGATLPWSEAAVRASRALITPGSALSPA